MGKNAKVNNLARKPSVLENLLFGCSLRVSPRLIPGFLLSAVLVVLAIWLTNLLNSAFGFSGIISYILTVIVIGIIIRNTVTIPAIFNPGIIFCLNKVLRLGIMLMGIRLSFFAILKIGAWGIPIVAVCVVAGLLIAVYLSRRLKLSERLGTLIAVGTSICGSTAIVAVAPSINAKDEEVSYAVANITIFGILAMLTYPFLAHVIFNHDPIMIGLFTGTSIHETAQVAAAGLIHDQTFGVGSNIGAADVAMITKLVRNVSIAMVVPIMSFIYLRRARGAQHTGGPWYHSTLKLFPLFILGFLFMAVFRSIGDANIQSGGLVIGLWSEDQWLSIIKTVSNWSIYALATAMAGVGLGTSFKNIKGLGIKPFYVGLVAATMVGLVSLIMVLLLGNFITL